MVRIKQRYMLCKLVHKSGNRLRVFGHTQLEVEQAVRNNIERLYGLYGAALCRELSVKYLRADTGMIIFRFDPKGQHVVGGAVCNTVIGEFHFRICQVAGSGRTVTKKLIRILRADIVEAASLFSARDRETLVKTLRDQASEVESGGSAVTY